MERKERRLGLILLAPTLVLMSGFVVFPALYAGWLSLNQSDPFRQTLRFVGLTNFVEVLAGEDFWHSLWVGCIFTVATVTFQIGFGVAVALVLHRPFRGRSLARALTLFPYIIPTIVATLLWRWLLNDSYGIVNHVLRALGLITTP